MKKIKRSKKGFTLIELIVVIAVIAILAAVLLPRFTGFSDSAKKSSVVSDAKNIATAVTAIKTEGETVNKDNIAKYGISYKGDLYVATSGDFFYLGDNGYAVGYNYETGELTKAVASDAFSASLFSSDGVSVASGDEIK